MMIMVDEFNFFLVVTNTCIKCKNKFVSEANAMKDMFISLVPWPGYNGMGKNITDKTRI